MRLIGMIVVAASTLGLSLGSVSAKETIINLHAYEDPAAPPDASVCVRAPFTPNALVGGSLATYRTRASDGAIVESVTQKVGRASGCALVTSLEPFAQGNLYIEMTMGDETFIGLGVCTVASNLVPTPGIVTVACALNLMNPHDPVKGGVMVSSSVLDPFGLGTAEVGSYWTIRLYQ